MTTPERRSNAAGIPGRGAAVRPLRLLLAGCLVSLLGGPVAGAVLESDQTLSREGYFQLHWEADEPVRLVEATRDDFSDARLLYSGSDSARVISGKPDGTWYYRLEAAAGGTILSPPTVVTVRHHSLQRAWSFFLLGGVVFIATLALILFARPEADERSR